ncbi:unnamed protein product [Clonostachys chloroleuca]|uniref:Heterokaryon incompatibility domain-containing protein n=1 Tax=Clonostachys chloroleuca TaxID=1926264 RepID=A0AA35MBP0_9HYPO|nr:unnamed protein product [Clonostachys chloroleuca]
MELQNGMNRRGLPYTNLLPNHIRLFRINPNTSAPNAGSLEVVSLDAAPPFYALSHSWGTQARDTALQIDGYMLNVTSELASGIRRMKELAAQHGGISPSITYIWIDSLCIDQQNIPERSSQVTLMRRIYSQSITTLIWLGPGNDSYSAAWSLIDQIYGVFQSQHPTTKSLGDIPLKTFSDASHAASGLPELNHLLWTQMRQLVELRWFSRIWVIQEVVLSAQDPIILHGQHVFSWRRLEWACAWMYRNGYMRLKQIPEQLRNIDTIRNIRQSQTLWPLDALMSITQVKFHATNQRDKIYALLGLAAESQDGSDLPEALRPDYSLEVEETYLKVAHFLLKRNGSLSILTRAHGTSGSLTRRQRLYDLKNLPSWAPDWSDFRVFNSGLRTSLSWVHYLNPEETPHLGFPPHYTASANDRLKLYDTPHNRMIRVSGIRLGEVIRAVSFSQNEQSKEEFKLLLDSKLKSIWHLAISVLKGSNESDIITWATSFIKAMTADQHRLIGRMWDQSFKDGLAYLLRLLEHHESHVTLGFAQTDTEKAMKLLKSHAVGGKPEEFATLACTYCFNRCFIVTSTGSIGIGPSDTRVGDSVSVILGSGVPYIIRKRETGWNFIGESYLEGFMDGEAPHASREGLIQEQIFDII